MMSIGPRVTMVMGEDIPLLAIFSRKTANGVPAVAIIFQFLTAAALMLTRSFEAVLDFIQFALTLSSFVTVLGVIVLRYRQPGLPGRIRPGAIPRRLSSFLLSRPSFFSILPVSGLFNRSQASARCLRAFCSTFSQPSSGATPSRRRDR